MGSSLIIIFSIYVTGDPMIENKRWKVFTLHLSALNHFKSAKSFKAL